MKGLLLIIGLFISYSLSAQTGMDSVWAPKIVNYQLKAYQINFFVDHRSPAQTTPNGFHYYPAKAKVYEITATGLVFIKMVPAKWPNGVEAEVRSQSFDFSKLVIEALKP